MSSPQADLTVIIPAFNEAQGIAGVLKNAQAELGDIASEILVVDDGSRDDTAAIAEAAGVRVIRHPINRGYGAALKTGIKAAVTSHVVTLDSDGQHKAEDVRLLWQTCREQQADMVIGARQGLIHSQLWRMPGKWFLRWMANYITHTKIPDLNSGLRLMHRETALRYLHLCPEGFSISTTLTIAFLQQRLFVVFAPITVNKRLGKSTVRVSTGFETIFLILRLAALFNPLRIFLPISFFCLATGALWAIPYLLFARGLSITASLVILTGILMFSLGLICDQISQLRLERYK